MKLQTDAHSCGVYAIINALRAVGVRVSAKQVRTHTATTKEEGTSQWGIRNCLERLGFTGADFIATKRDAFKLLTEHLRDGRSVVLSVEDGRHWVAAIGLIGDRVITYDSWMAAWNAREQGVDCLSRKQLMDWWQPDADDLYYGVVVEKSK